MIVNFVVAQGLLEVGQLRVSADQHHFDTGNRSEILEHFAGDVVAISRVVGAAGVDAAALAQLRPSAYLVNIARGEIIDTAALIAALEQGRLAGAALDVFPEEPLPPASPLWKMPNVFITPHIGGISPHYMDRAAAMFADNLRRYVNGQPLVNRFEVDRGY